MELNFTPINQKPNIDFEDEIADELESSYESVTVNNLKNYTFGVALKNSQKRGKSVSVKCTKVKSSLKMK